MRAGSNGPTLMIFHGVREALTQRGPALTLAELADAVGCNAKTAGNAVEWMVQFRYLVRTKRPGARMAYRYELGPGWIVVNLRNIGFTE